MGRPQKYAKEAENKWELTAVPDKPAPASTTITLTISESIQLTITVTK